MRRILYAAPIPFERKLYEQEVLIEEILTSRTLAVGTYIANLAAGTNLALALPAGGGFGIVATYDPAKAFLDLAVEADQNSASTVAVQPGTAMFPNGEIIVIGGVLSRVAVANTAPGSVNVVFLQFAEEEVDTVWTRTGVLVNTKVIYPEDPVVYVQSVDITTWQGYTSLDLETKIPLAVVSVDSTGGLQIDQSRSVLATNRPWFSPVDIDHRSRLGTGLVTSANPHGMSVNDLSASNGATILDLLTTSGQLVVKDSALTKVPGHVCQDIIPPGSIIHDVTGVVTGVQGAYYFFLSRFPQQLVRVTLQDTGGIADEIPDLAGMLAPGRNLVVLINLDEQVLNASKSIVCEYVAVDLLSPTDVPLITQSLAFKPAYTTRPSDEAAVAGGLVVQQPVLTHSMGDAGPFPSLYRLFLRGDSFIYKTPQPVFCYMLLTQMGTSAQAASIAMLGPARLRVGLTAATAGPNLSVQVKINGFDTGNNQINETITFGSAWAQDISIGTSSEMAILNSKIYQYTVNTFSKLTSVQLVQAPANAGPSAALAVWADLEQTGTSTDPLLTTIYTGSGAAAGLPLVDIVWDGAKVSNDPSGVKPKLTDLRPVSTTILPARTPSVVDALRSAYTSGGGSPPRSPTWWGTYENFDSPRWIANRYGFEHATAHDISNPDEFPRFNTTRMSRLQEGLGRRDVYVSRPIAARPYANSLIDPLPALLRFIPVGRGPFNYRAGGLEGFSLWARVFLSDGIGWSSWLNATGNPNTTTFTDLGSEYQVDLSVVPLPGGIGNVTAVSKTQQLIKFQFVCTGPVRGMMVMTDFASPTSVPPEWVYDLGIWDDLVGGGNG